MKVTAAGIDRIQISNADASGHDARFIVWLYLQIEEDGTQTGQELVVSVPYDSSLTFDDLAMKSFEKARGLLVAACQMDESMWWRKFNRSLEPLPEWSPAPQ
ncbi:MAG: hypothetical protein K5872_08970 [Rhizobiaceae bacterium]|nr:hypothetical protein [Rhizobiaceae bacterium]MCV0406346.1 hypothetical protein [Rhizobiaceae bacterium]